MMNTVRRWFDRFWFAPGTAQGMALLRITSGCYAFYYLYTRYSMLTRIAGSSQRLFEPVGVARILDAPLAEETFAVILTCTLIANVAYTLGVAYRLSGPAFAGLLLAVLCYRNSWGMIYHSHNLLVWHVLILGFTRAADCLSLDRVLSSSIGGRVNGLTENDTSRPEPHWRYGWPVKLICSVTVATYFLAGAAKLLGPLGWRWMTGITLRSQIAADVIRKEMLGSEAAWLPGMLYDQLWLFALLGVAVMVLELGAPAAVFNKRTGIMWGIAAFLFHWGVFGFMGITFRYQLCGAAFVSFFVNRGGGDRLHQETA